MMSWLRSVARACTLGGLLLSLGAAPSGAQAARLAEPIVIAYLRPDSVDLRQRDFDRGARMAFREAERAAELLGREIRLVELSPALDSARTSEMLAAASAPVAVFPALDSVIARKLASWGGNNGAVVVTSRSTARSTCVMAVFRTSPGASVRAAALAAAQGTAGDPAARAGARIAARPSANRDSSVVVLWHPELVRFGARQLNERYRSLYHTPMSSDAWEGWMAAKIVWESALRTTRGDLAGTIARGAFDGHKGSALRFGATDRVLHQPLIVASSAGEADNAPGALVAEVPWPTSAADSVTTELPTCAR